MVELHHPCRKGRIFEFADKHIVSLDPRFKRSMKSIIIKEGVPHMSAQ